MSEKLMSAKPIPVKPASVRSASAKPFQDFQNETLQKWHLLFLIPISFYGKRGIVGLTTIRESASSW
jgi:hypothetical protein